MNILRKANGKSSGRIYTFREHRVNFIQIPATRLDGKTYFLKYLALSCLKAGLKVQLLTSYESVRDNYNNFLFGYRAPIHKFIVHQHVCKANVVICDHYLEATQRKILKRNISNPNVHVIVVTHLEIPEEFKKDERIKFTKWALLYFSPPSSS
jgi:hypothetical protein